MKAENMNMGITDKLICHASAFAWKLMKILDPFKVQNYFASRVNVVGAEINRVHSASTEDAANHICRINNNRMKDGEGFIAKRGELIKIFNPENGQFILRFAQGSGELRIRYKEVALDYDAKARLGILKTDEVDLQVMKANPADREFYLMYMASDPSSRQSRALGWYLLIFSLLSSAIGWIGNTLGAAIF